MIKKIIAGVLSIFLLSLSCSRVGATFYGCVDGACVSVGDDAPSCSPNYGSPDCYNQCGNLSNACDPHPTPTPTPTPSPTSTPNPTPTLSSTPAPSSGTGSTSSSSSSSGGGAFCTSSGITVAPTIVEANRTDPKHIFVKWGPYAGLNNFIVQYGFKDGDWRYSTEVSGFLTTIGNLPPNQPIWVRVAATDNCVVGPFGASKFVDGSSNVNSLNTTTFVGNPGFPDTGFDPSYKYFFWKILAGTSLFFTMIYLGKKIYKSCFG